MRITERYEASPVSVKRVVAHYVSNPAATAALSAMRLDAHQSKNELPKANLRLLPHIAKKQQLFRVYGLQAAMFTGKAKELETRKLEELVGCPNRARTLTVKA